MLVPPGRPLSPGGTCRSPIGSREIKNCTPHGSSSACLPVYLLLLCWGCYQRAGARTIIFQDAGALWATPRHEEAAPCAHRRPDFVVREPPGRYYLLVCLPCTFTPHTYSASLSLALLLYSRRAVCAPMPLHTDTSLVLQTVPSNPLPRIEQGDEGEEGGGMPPQS